MFLSCVLKNRAFPATLNILGDISKKEPYHNRKEVSARRVKRWAFSLQELLRDPAGKEQFYKFLDKEFSAENLKFYDAVQELKTNPCH
ncbi:regulator of G-protein signaling 7 [Caerostris extrusa]|uniref:Regulator of G-protein signaling 7 n=1 Tax=Caerostris extrusa TaxID=172846 RepID=A0AAV4Y8S5_CAEEX|nr:regulator of G-protein signaling 7 [Caerostris extrusa]